MRIWAEKRPTVVFVTHDLDEAIALGQRVVLMAPRPGRIQRILDVTLPHPRERTDVDFTPFRKQLFTKFHLVHRQATEETEYSI